MAWTAFPTWAVGQISLASDWNTYVAGNGNFLYQAPYFSVYNNSATSLTTSTLTQIGLTGTTWLGYGCTLSSNSVVVPVTGSYWVTGAVYLSMTSGILITDVAHNGTTVYTGVATAGSGGALIANASGLVLCSAGDTLSLYGEQTSGGTVNTNTGATVTYLSGYLVGSQ